MRDLTTVGAHLHGEAGAPRCIHHGAHGGQVAAREDVLPDEVRGCAVRLIALVRLRYGLRGRTCADYHTAIQMAA